MMLRVMRVRSPFLRAMAGWEDCLVVLDGEDLEIEKTVSDLLDAGRAIRVQLRDRGGRVLAASTKRIQ